MPSPVARAMTALRSWGEIGVGGEADAASDRTGTLKRFPTLTAARLFDMVKAQGYPGAPDHFCHRIAQIRLHRPREALYSVRLRFEGNSGLQL